MTTESSELIQPVEPSQNGHKRVGLQDGLGISGEGGGYFELSKILLEAPDDFSELLARTRFSQRQITIATRLLAKAGRYQRGSVSVEEIIYNTARMLIGQDGQARAEAIQASTGSQTWQSKLKTSWLGGLFGGNREGGRPNNVAQRDINQ